ncbi:MAG TPA: efflux RND transporter permease subunit, partial [Helicobacteraceae bacterium]|nr:efflux RND transporter permease subunit [Helicobacteraceae bacterium]
ILVSILVLTVGLMKMTKFQLFPDFDVTQVYITGKVNINNDLEDTEKVVSKLEQDVLKHIDPKEVSSVTSVIGMRLDAKNHAEIGENLFHIFIDLHERAPDNFFNKYINPYLSLDYNASILSRARPAEAIEKDVKEWIAKTKASEKAFEEVVVSKPQTGVVAHDIEIALGGMEDKKLLEGLEKLQKALASIDGVSNIANDAEIGEKELKIKVNAYGEELGLDEQQLSNELRALYLKGEYGKIFNSSGLVRMRIESTQKDSIASIKNVEVHIPNSDQKIALSEVADFIFQQAFVTISKDDAERIRTVTASLNKKKNTSSEVMKKLEPTLDELKANGYKLTIKGEEQENAKTQKEMSQAGLAAIFLIFITLVWLFDSLKNSLIVLSTIPLVFLGVLVGHMIMGINLTMPSMIGVIGLAGVVVNDGLIMVSFIRNAKDVETLMRKAKTRLRPILMTSITTVLGLSTLIFFASGQAMILQPMAISLGFGIIWATVLNLLYVPLFYAVSHRIKKV